MGFDQFESNSMATIFYFYLPDAYRNARSWPLVDAEERLDRWRDHYNQNRPDRALESCAAHEFAIFSRQAYFAGKS
jgi:hypothetical protein